MRIETDVQLFILKDFYSYYMKSKTKFYWIWSNLFAYSFELLHKMTDNLIPKFELDLETFEDKNINFYYRKRFRNYFQIYLIFALKVEN